MGHLVGWVSSRSRRCVTFQLRCNSTSSSWVSNVFLMIVFKGGVQ